MEEWRNLSGEEAKRRSDKDCASMILSSFPPFLLSSIPRFLDSYPCGSITRSGPRRMDIRGFSTPAAWRTGRSSF